MKILRMIKNSIALCGLFGLMVNVGYSQTIVIQEGVNGYSGTVDTYIQSGGDNVININ